jgi:hypothetical protein
MKKQLAYSSPWCKKTVLEHEPLSKVKEAAKVIFKNNETVCQYKKEQILIE